jgi:hypothetical protein
LTLKEKQIDAVWCRGIMKKVADMNVFGKKFMICFIKIRIIPEVDL